MQKNATKMKEIKNRVECPKKDAAPGWGPEVGKKRSLA